MYEINVAALETDSRDFPLARRAVLGRYNHLYEEHTPGGRLNPRTRRTAAGVRCGFIHGNRHESHADRGRCFQLWSVRSGLDPVSWTSSERGIRCRPWRTRRAGGGGGASRMTTRRGRYDWSSMRARRSRPRRAIWA